MMLNMYEAHVLVRGSKLPTVRTARILLLYTTRSVSSSGSCSAQWLHKLSSKYEASRTMREK